MYRIAGKFGGGRFGELTPFEYLAKESSANFKTGNRLLIVSNNLMVLVWRIADDSPNFPAIRYAI